MTRRETAEEAVLDCIRSYEGKPFGPSRRDLAAATGYGTGTCQDIVVSLAERGVIDYSPNIARSIRIKKG